MKLIGQELNLMNSEISKSLLSLDNKLSSDIYDLVFAKSKRLRPKLIFLFANAFNKPVNDKVIALACATELLHNSSLIHDDIIDNSDIRRGKETLNKKFGNSISVLAGDYLLSLAMQFLCKCDNINCLQEFSKSFQLMCNGEINQHFELKKIPVIDDYIQKSQNKTAELYRASLLSLCHILNINNSKEVEEFAINFGIAFQLKDDLINIKNTDPLKPAFSDILNGIYTAPVIFLNKDVDVKSISSEKILELLLKDNKYFEQSEKLIKLHVENAINSLTLIENNEYKEEILNLVRNLI